MHAPLATSHLNALAHVDTWVFDLDNTLYPAHCSAYLEIDHRIRAYIAELLDLDEAAARERQKGFFRTYGTSLLGLMREFGADPKPFLSYVHDVDLGCIAADTALDSALDALPGRKIIFTNADAPYAERVLARIGIRRHFEDIFDIEAAAYLPKPHRATYERLLAKYGIDTRRAAMVEDLARNLAPAAALGMTTVWVKNETEWTAMGDDTFAPHHVVEHLESWIRAISVR